MFKLMLPALLGLVSTSCISLSSLQTARPTKEGKISGSVGLGSIGLRFLKKEGEDKSIYKAIESLRLPVIEGGIRYGINSSSDIGGRLSVIPGNIGVDYKYMLSGENSDFATATGLKVDLTSYTSGSGKDESKFSVTDFVVPIYLSYDVAELTSFYISPLIGMRMYSATGTDGKASGQNVQYGANLGFAIDWFVAEYAFRSSAGTEGSLITDQITVGFRFPTDNLGRKASYAAKSSSEPSMEEVSSPSRENKKRPRKSNRE